jgi:hypothetical protein
MLGLMSLMLAPLCTDASNPPNRNDASNPPRRDAHPPPPPPLPVSTSEPNDDESLNWYHDADRQYEQSSPAFDEAEWIGNDENFGDNTENVSPLHSVEEEMQAGSAWDGQAPPSFFQSLQDNERRPLEARQDSRPPPPPPPRTRQRSIFRFFSSSVDKQKGVGTTSPPLKPIKYRFADFGPPRSKADGVPTPVDPRRQARDPTESIAMDDKNDEASIRVRPRLDPVQQYTSTIRGRLALFSTATLLGAAMSLIVQQLFFSWLLAPPSKSKSSGLSLGVMVTLASMTLAGLVSCNANRSNPYASLLRSCSVAVLLAMERYRQVRLTYPISLREAIFILIPTFSKNAASRQPYPPLVRVNKFGDRQSMSLWSYSYQRGDEWIGFQGERERDADAATTEDVIAAMHQDDASRTHRNRQQERIKRQRDLILRRKATALQEFNMLYTMIAMIWLGAVCGSSVASSLPLVPTWIGTLSGAAVFVLYLTFPDNHRGDFGRLLGMRLVALIKLLLKTNAELRITQQTGFVAGEILDKLLVLDRKHRVREQLGRTIQFLYRQTTQTMSSVSSNVQQRQRDRDSNTEIRGADNGGRRTMRRPPPSRNDERDSDQRRPPPRLQPNEGERQPLRGRPSTAQPRRDDRDRYSNEYNSRRMDAEARGMREDGDYSPGAGFRRRGEYPDRDDNESQQWRSR